MYDIVFMQIVDTLQNLPDNVPYLRYGQFVVFLFNQIIKVVVHVVEADIYERKLAAGFPSMQNLLNTKNILVV